MKQEMTRTARLCQSHFICGVGCPGSQMCLWRGSCHFDSLLERMKGNESETQGWEDERSTTLQLLMNLINIGGKKMVHNTFNWNLDYKGCKLKYVKIKKSKKITICLTL